MGFLQLPRDLRAKIWSMVRRRHLIRKQATRITTPHGMHLARLEISPTKLMHLGWTGGVGMEQAIFELVEAGYLVQRSWLNERGWECTIWGRRNLECMTVLQPDSKIHGFVGLDQLPAGHVRGRLPPNTAETYVAWWNDFNDWREATGGSRLEFMPVWNAPCLPSL